MKPHFVGKWGANPNFSRRKSSEKSQLRVQWGKPIKRKMEVDNTLGMASATFFWSLLTRASSLLYTMRVNIHTHQEKEHMGETRQRILDAAEKLILLKGLTHVTTKEIFFALMAEHLPAFHDLFQTHQAGTATLSENLAALALEVIHYYEQLLPMGVSFLADKELLTQFRATTQPLGMGPHNLFQWVAAYLEEEQHLGRIGQHLPSLSIAILLLGPCFQWVFNRQFLGFDPFHKTEQQFAEELVQGVLAGILPS
jgi:AcrR family transcriptional regulator